MCGLVRAITGLMLFALATTAQAQDYPNRLIKLMVGFPPGGNVDTIARLMANEMAKGLGQQFVIENKAGLAGTFAADAVAHAPPDGYTLLVVPSAHPAAGAVQKNLKYRVVDDFAWISTVSFYPFVLTVKKDSKYKSVADIIAAARANPKAVSFGSAGVGSILHMAAELLAREAGVSFVHVPYRGEVPAITGLLGGDLDFVMTTPTPVLPHIQSGALRALAVTGKTRWPRLPDVPTVQEAGLKDYEVISWTGFAAPGGTPRPIVDKLNAEIRRAIQVPAVKTRLETLGGDVTAITPDEMRDLVAQQLATWIKVARESHIEMQ
jgi:tripartite-type tricarboxylate transporter receptor subunit TctC